MVDDEPAYELSFYCGTCPLLFRRLVTAREKLSLESTPTWNGLAHAIPHSPPDRAVDLGT